MVLIISDCVGAWTLLNAYANWFTIGQIAVTRAVGFVNKEFWEGFCEHRKNIWILFLLPWAWSFLINLPIYIDPSLEFGYHCQMGKCDVVPTGRPAKLPRIILRVNCFTSPFILIAPTSIVAGAMRIHCLASNPFCFFDSQIFPFFISYIAPLTLILVSYMVIWCRLRSSISYERTKVLHW